MRRVIKVLYGKHKDCVDFIVVLCPICKRLHFTYQDLRTHMVESHNTRRVIFRYADGDRSYSWSHIRTLNG